jgi:Family of unknown function (DUF6152)
LDWEAAVRSRFEASAFLVIGLVAFSVPLFAHHGNASYETKVITLKGTVTAWVWANPHVFLKVNVKDGQGKIVNWTAELVAPSNMINYGFTPQTFKPGDGVTMVTTAVAKTGAPVARLSEVILPNGQIMRPSGGNDGNASTREGAH